MIDADRPAWSAWLAGAVGLALTLWLFFPGYMSWDSAYQWWQVRHGIVDPIFPPVMGGIWRVTEWLSPGPGGYFLYQATLYWLAFAAFAASLSVPAWGRVLIVLGILILGTLVGILVGQFVRVSLFSGFDRFLGFVFGLLRGGVVIGVAVIIATSLRLDGERWWKQSKLIPYAETAGAAVRLVVGDAARSAGLPGVG